MTPVKPEKQTKVYYNYNDCSKYLQEKYGYNERDFANTRSHEKRYIEASGDVCPSDYSGATCHNGERFNYNFTYEGYDNSTIASWNIGGVNCTEAEAIANEQAYTGFKNRYLEWLKSNPLPPEEDFWQFMFDDNELFHNGCFWIMSREEYEYGISKENAYSPWPEFAKTIYNYYLNEFEDENGDVELWIEW